MHSEFWVGWTVGAREHAAIAGLPENAWTAAIDGDPRVGAAVVELTGMFAATRMTTTWSRAPASRSGTAPAVTVMFSNVSRWPGTPTRRWSRVLTRTLASRASFAGHRWWTARR